MLEHLVVFLAALGATACSNPSTTGGPPAGSRTIMTPTPFDAEHTEAVAKNPEGISFEVRLAGDKTRFQMGERVPIELSFSSRRPGTFVLDAAWQESSRDTYRVEPESGAPDPRHGHSRDAPEIGPVRMPVLGEKPEKLVFDLNVWHRFDRPGVYRLFVLSRRIHDESARAGRSRDQAPVASNLISFEITPQDPAWAAREIERAILLLDQATSKDEDRRNAARTLRFLGTDAAALATVERFRGGGNDYEFMSGLFGSKNRTLVVQSMEARLDDAGFPVTETFLTTLGHLRFALEDPSAQGSQKNPHARQELHDRYAARLAGAVSRKAPAARAVSLATLLERGWRDRPNAASPAWLAQIERSIAGAFLDLPHGMQEQLLRARWTRVRSPDLAPVLKALFERPDTPTELRSEALRRLLELDPAEGRRRLLETIETGKPHLGHVNIAMPLLRALPDATVAELDAPLAARFEADVAASNTEDLQLVTALLARYATAGALPRVQAAAQSEIALSMLGADQGRARASLVGYFNRVAPAIGAGALREALVGMSASSQAELLRNVAEVFMSPETERALVGLVEQAEPDAVAVAAQALKLHGSAAAEAPLWKRLERWHAQWSGKQEQLVHRWTEPRDEKRSAEVHLEGKLWWAIADGRGWLADRAKLERLGGLLVSRYEKEQLGHRLHAWTSNRLTLAVAASESGDVKYDLAHYSGLSQRDVEKKLQQLPRGTVLELNPYASEQLFQDTRALVQRAGLTLERAAWR
ncbi:hypothetical protein A7982_13487 [Minicystis rosea]|nr:hypothetical protein A7982_13487 [Minicystis rosea]